MNYILHLNCVFQLFAKDSRINPAHISLYMALFQHWNLLRFPEVFYINRGEIMQFAKIGSLPTYHRCLKNLDDWKYIKYFPSHNPYKGSKIKILIFDTSTKQAVNEYETSGKQALTPKTNNNKQVINIIKHKLPKTEIEVIEFFKSKNWPALEGLKFYNHYQAIGWKIGGKMNITDWHATASSWMLKAEELRKEKNQAKNSGYKTSIHQDNLKTTTVKNYEEPL